MKSKTFAALFGLLAIVAILGTSSEITTMTASAQSTLTGRHCTASQPCVQICGDHVCAPGELNKIKSQSAQTQSNNSGTSAIPSPYTTIPSTGVILGGKVSYMDVASDGTAVIVSTSHPLSGQPLAIGIGFKDTKENFVQHQNYAITVTQDNNVVLSNTTGHTHSGTDSLTTSVLTSNNPVDIKVTLNGVGLPGTDPSTWTGVKGEVLSFSQVLDVQAPLPTAPITNMTNATSAPVGNAPVPEFGAIAALILVIAITSIIVMSKTRSKISF
jgi:predicted secreted protein with PEFG-CTERM motif